MQEKRQSYQDIAKSIDSHFEKIKEKWNDASNNMTESEFAELDEKIEKLDKYFAVEEDKIGKQLAEAGKVVNDAAYAIAGEGAKNAKKMEAHLEKQKGTETFRGLLETTKATTA